MKSDDFEPYSPQRVLAVGAHADDIDFGASGSIASWVMDGAVVEYLVITNGCKGSSDPNITCEELIATRQAEQRNAAETLGAANVEFLDFEDGELEITMELKRELVRAIRRFCPDTVVVMDPTMVYSTRLGFINHSDHRAAGQATLDAVYPLARDHLSFPELTDDGLEPHKVAHLLLINLDEQNCFVDISGTFDLKLAALAKHTSQLPDTKATFGMLRTRAEELGKLAGCDFAESFVRLDIPA